MTRFSEIAMDSRILYIGGCVTAFLCAALARKFGIPIEKWVDVLYIIPLWGIFFVVTWGDSRVG